MKARVLWIFSVMLAPTSSFGCSLTIHTCRRRGEVHVIRYTP
jgi:hypothetical protein